MALDIDDVVLPAIYLAGSTETLVTSTLTIQRAAGIETRRAQFPIPKEEFDLQVYSGKVQFLQQLFRTEQGPQRAFLFDDVDDDVATNVELQKATLGGVTVCQLRQAYLTLSVYDASIVQTVYAPIYRFKTGTLAVTVDDVAVSSPGDYSEADGLITFTSVISGTVKASCEPYKVVRFSDDQMDATWIDFDQRQIDSAKVVTLFFLIDEESFADWTGSVGASSGGGGSFTADTTAHTADDSIHTADMA